MARAVLPLAVGPTTAMIFGLAAGFDMRKGMWLNPNRKGVIDMTEFQVLLSGGGLILAVAAFAFWKASRNANTPPKGSGLNVR